MTEDKFDISWRNGRYFVSIPNYEGGTVYTAEFVNALTGWIQAADVITNVKRLADASALADKHGGVWREHPDHRVEDWKYEVANDDTRRSYWDWVLAKLESTS